MNATLTAPHGWELISTGGGCTAFYRPLFRPATLHTLRSFYALITSAEEGDWAPTDGDEPVLLGLYDDDDQQIAWWEVLNTASAVTIITSLRHFGGQDVEGNK